MQIAIPRRDEISIAETRRIGAADAAGRSFTQAEAAAFLGVPVTTYRIGSRQS
jgi:hypothetical protein